MRDARHVPNILTIAGSDSGGGAGIQADLKTIAMLGGFGMSVITALTSQNGLGVDAIHAPEPGFAAQQLTTVLAGFPLHAAKTGMLFSAPIIHALADVLDAEVRERGLPLVVDPVCVSQSGHALLQEDAVAALKERMLPLAALLTPNVPEAERLTGRRIADAASARETAVALLALGPKAVLLKGGHFGPEADAAEGGGRPVRGTVTDWLALPGAEPVGLAVERVDTVHTHGTGCTLSAAIATGLGHGLGMEEAVRKAQAYLNLCLRAGYAPGKGYGPPRHDAPLVRERARAGVLRALDEAVDVLQTTPGMHRLVPEVRLNLALALPWPMGLDDVAAYTGRVTRTRAGRVMACGCPAFGASSHMAKVVLAARRFNPEIACAASIACNPDVERAVREAGLTAARFDRADEPADVREREGSSLEWGTMDALARAEDPRAVDAVADRGGDGKEPIIRILGRDVPEVLGKLTAIIDRL